MDNDAILAASAAFWAEQVAAYDERLAQHIAAGGDPDDFVYVLRGPVPAPPALQVYLEKMFAADQN